MPESWVQCVTRVYKQNKTKYGKDADGKFKYKLKNAMKDAKKVYKSAKKTDKVSRKFKKSGRKSRKNLKKGGDPDAVTEVAAEPEPEVKVEAKA